METTSDKLLYISEMTDQLLQLSDELNLCTLSYGQIGGGNCRADGAVGFGRLPSTETKIELGICLAEVLQPDKKIRIMRRSAPRRDPRPVRPHRARR